MSGTVIEQLTTKLTLDVTGFKKGIDEAKKSIDELKGSGEAAGDTIGGMVGAGAKRATGGLGALGSMLGKGGIVGIGIGAALYLGKKLDDSLFKIAVSLRQVSIESKNVGQSAAGLRNLQNASALAGGSLEDATQTVGNLQKSLFDLRFNGQVSDQIVMLSRLGVQFQDSYGRAREFNDVMLDTADALEKAQKNGEMTRPEAAIFAERAGFTGGMQQLVLSGRSGIEAQLAKQKARTQVNDTMTGAAAAEVNASISLGQALESGQNQIVEKTGRGRAALQEGFEHSPEALGKAFDFVGEAATKVGDAFVSLAHTMGQGTTSTTGRTSSMVGRPGAWASTIREAGKRYGVREDILEGLIRQESHFDPGALGGTTRSGERAVGIAQFLPSTAKSRGFTAGKDSGTDINEAARYMGDLHKQALAHGYEGDTAWIAAANAYHSGMGNVLSGQNIGSESRAYGPKVFRGIPGLEDAAQSFKFGSEGRGAGDVHTDIQIDSITVNTQATDANGIAGDMVSATRRKFLAAQAEPGPN